jgi:hypothetical protein
MSNVHPLATVSADGVEICFPENKQGLMKRLLSTKPVDQSFTHLGVDHQDMLFALADLRNWQDQHPDEVDIEEDRLRLSHDAAAYLSTKAAELLGLPSDVHLTLKTDVTGVLGKPDFKLAYEWSRHGRRENPKRVGAFLKTAEGPRRIPLWMKRAIDLSDNFDGSRPIEEHWSALAAFRQALEPDDDISSELPDNRDMAALSMTAFLRGLEVRTANRFSISPDKTLGQFEVVPYSAKNLNAAGISSDDISESDAELSGETLAVFQHRLRTRGARPAYQLGGNSYLVIDRSSAPILEEMARVQQADRAERKAFVDNPRVFITEAVNRHLSEQGALEGLDAAGQEELVESVAGPALIESREYSERVTGVTVYTKPAADFEGSGTAWLPEVFDVLVSEIIRNMPLEDLKNLQNQMQVLVKGETATTTLIGDNQVEVTPARLAAVTGEVERRERENALGNNKEAGVEDGKTGPIILDTLDNFETLSWHAKLSPRKTTAAFTLPEAIITPLRDHQHEYFSWATKAWASGLPGILNADEQGLGKTLQTIAFLNWLQIHMSDQSASVRGPILIVAPTSLLRNWEEEVERHVAPRKFGTLIRLYGSSLSGQKRSGARGTETGTGLPLLDFDWLEEAFEEGRAHRYWILTTYTTLANYQHSLGKIPFSALVMDEIQNIKNHSTIASKAAEAMNADFRIGLTGTPIENSTMDLWTIMDRIAPGSLGAGSEFKSRFGTPDADNMTQLYEQLFKSHKEHPPLGLRRLKEEVARDLPSKTRRLYPRLMPDVQARTYDIAQQKLGIGGLGAALKMLHHIRSVSVHPGISEIVAPEDFVGMSARLSATMEILNGIKARGERALVFIEHRNMQFRFAELVRHYFGLEQINVINGDTPIPRRQEIVNHFQRHLTNDGGFDMLILGPKSAGTGLTLTAATNVIHLSRWWNPAVEEQCNDRVHRIGQTKPVEVHVPLAIHPSYGAQSFDCLLQSLMQRKRRLASQALWPMGDTKCDLSDLHAGLASTAQAHSESVISDSMKILFERDSLPVTKPDENGSYVMP